MNKLIIDVREPSEYETSHVDGAINIPIGQLNDSGLINDVPKDTNIITYCMSGHRAGLAVNILKIAGYKNVENGINQSTIEKNI
jgi:rhodanese-related sulfurtransferase